MTFLTPPNMHGVAFQSVFKGVVYLALTLFAIMVSPV